MKSSIVAATLGGVLSLAGCVTEGRDFHSDVAWIKANKTSMQDVQLLLRDPYSVGNSGGRPTWTYGYYKYKLIGASHQKELKFYWNPDGTVSTYGFTSNFPDDTGRNRATTPVSGAATAPAAVSPVTSSSGNAPASPRNAPMPVDY
ncbi:MAG: hypothetical protein NTY08_08725 [Proteobacteria bacterium]|nr:hypothetical protein [Pseudomonadota bacterium]